MRDVLMNKSETHPKRTNKASNPLQSSPKNKESTNNKGNHRYASNLNPLGREPPLSIYRGLNQKINPEKGKSQSPKGNKESSLVDHDLQMTGSSFKNISNFSRSIKSTKSVKWTSTKLALSLSPQHISGRGKDLKFYSEAPS